MPDLVTYAAAEIAYFLKIGYQGLFPWR